MMSGMFWGDMKDLWGILELKARAQMVILTVHMRGPPETNLFPPSVNARKKTHSLELASLEGYVATQEGTGCTLCLCHEDTVGVRRYCQT